MRASPLTKALWGAAMFLAVLLGVRLGIYFMAWIAAVG